MTTTDISEREWLRDLARWCVRRRDLSPAQRADWIAAKIVSDVLAEEAEGDSR